MCLTKRMIDGRQATMDHDGLYEHKSLATCAKYCASFLSQGKVENRRDILSYLKDEDTGIRTSLALPDYPELLIKFLIFLVELFKTL